MLVPMRKTGYTSYMGFFFSIKKGKKFTVMGRFGVGGWKIQFV